MHRSRFLFIGLLGIATLGGAEETKPAPRTPPAPLRAEVLLGADDSARTVRVRDIRSGKVSILMEKGKGEVRIDVKDIRRMDFYLGESVEGAIQAVEEKKYASAAEALRAPALRLMPFLVIPENNALSVTESYRLALHHLDDADALREYYGEVAEVLDDERARTAKVWLAYLDARSGLVDGVEDAFKAFGESERGDEVDLLRNLALCRIELPGEEYRVAVDYAAKAVAACDAENLLYPEAMYLSAQCYDGLAKLELARLAEERREKVVRELLVERVRVARKLEAKADQVGAASPTEQEILDNVDRNAVDARVPALPELKEISHSKTAQRAYLFLERVFPDTSWGELASENVLAESREGSDQNLVMSKKEQTPPQKVQAKGESKQGVAKGETLKQFLTRIKAERKKKKQPYKESNFKKVFSNMDGNNDGLLTREEVRIHSSKKK